MNFLKNIVGRIMALWAMLVFIITMFIFLLPVGLSVLWQEPKRSRIAYRFYKVWMTVFFILVGVRRKIVGRNNFKTGENYVIVCNHNSLMDPPLSSPAIPAANKTIAKAEMARIPLFGIVYKRGSVLVDRKSEESRRSSYLKMKEVLDQGLHMVIYPEGTRNKSTQPLQRFHDGAFRLAIDTQKSIIPALLFNTAKVMPRKPFFFWPQKVEMHFIAPVSVAGKTMEQLKEEVFDIMHDYYVKHR